MFKTYRPKNVPKGMGGFKVQIEGQLSKQMGPVTAPGRLNKLADPVKFPKKIKRF